MRAYNLQGDLQSITDPLNQTTFMRYDAARQLLQVTGPDPDGAGTLKNRAEVYTYNVNGQVITTSRGTANADGSGFAALQIESNTFDTNGRVTGVTVAGGQTNSLVQYSYDGLGRVQCVAQRMNGAQSDACVSTMGASGSDRVARTTYDVVGRPASSTKAYGTTEASTESTGYTTTGQVAWVQDGEANRTSYVYDVFDRPVSTTYPGGSYEQLTYDANGNVTSRLLRDGQVINYTYDALNRLTFEDRPGTANWETDHEYGYDLQGRLTSASDKNGRVLGFTYDALGRRVAQSDTWYPFGSATMLYDAAGRRTRLTWADGNYVSYEYDNSGSTTVIRENGGLALASFSYDDLGRRKQLTRGNGTVTSYSYDAALRPSSLTHDLAGTAQDVSTSFTYNPVGQINSRTLGNDSYAWTGHYNVDRNYGTNGLNQLTNAGATTLGYDVRGNLAQSGSSTFTYTADNKMATAFGGGLAHDPMGRLFNVAIGSANYVFTYDDASLSAESTTSGTLLRRYVYGPGTDEPLIWYEGTGLSDRRYLHADERGSIVAVTNTVGAALAINKYDEFGIPAAGNLGRFQYTGQKWIPELGLYDYKARIYSPTLGRFMQTDPIGYGDSINWYNYVGSDPVNKVDSLGLDGEQIFVNGKRYQPVTERPQSLSFGFDNWFPGFREQAPGPQSHGAIARFDQRDFSAQEIDSAAQVKKSKPQKKIKPSDLADAARRVREICAASQASQACIDAKQDLVDLQAAYHKENPLPKATGSLGKPFWTQVYDYTVHSNGCALGVATLGQGNIIFQGVGMLGTYDSCMGLMNDAMGR